MEGMKGIDAKAKKKLRQYDKAYSLDEARNYVACTHTIDTNRIPTTEKVEKTEPKLVS